MFLQIYSNCIENGSGLFDFADLDRILKNAASNRIKEIFVVIFLALIVFH